MTDTQKKLEEFDWEFMQPDNYPWMGTDVTGNEIKKFLITKIQEAIAEERSKLLLELLQVFNDYDVPLTMTAEQVRDILEEYLTKKD